MVEPPFHSPALSRRTSYHGIHFTPIIRSNPFPALHLHTRRLHPRVPVGIVGSSVLAVRVQGK
jgi:hypothetical protein